MSESADEKLIQQLEEELKKVKVSDLLVQTFYTVSLARLQPARAENRDLEQAKLAIEAMRALVPVLEGTVPEEVVRDFSQVTRTCSWPTRKRVSAKPARCRGDRRV